MPLNNIRRRIAVAAAFAAFALMTAPAYAAGSNMPWEQPLNQILASIQGPVTKVIAVIVIISIGEEEIRATAPPDSTPCVT